MDADRDGKLSRDEWLQRYGDDKMFDLYDADGDGIISPEEWLSGEAARKAFDDADIDHDGKLSRQEWILKYGSDAGFDMYDLDGDGFVDADEFIRAKQQQLQESGALPPRVNSYQLPSGPWVAYALLLTSVDTFQLVVTHSPLCAWDPNETNSPEELGRDYLPKRTCYEGTYSNSGKYDDTHRLRLTASRVDSTDQSELPMPVTPRGYRRRDELACEAHIICVQMPPDNLFMAGESIKAALELKPQSFLNACLIIDAHGIELERALRDAGMMTNGTEWQKDEDLGFLKKQVFWFGFETQDTE